MSWTKAEYIEWAYDDAAYDDMPSEGCYALAIAWSTSQARNYF